MPTKIDADGVADSDLLYLRARYYDPTTAQFLTRDPAVRLTRQPYTYAGDSPLNATDPTGLSDCKATGQTTRGQSQEAAEEEGAATLDATPGGRAYSAH